MRIIIITLLLFGLAGCSQIDKKFSIDVNTGQGEYQNKHRTDRTEVRAAKYLTSNIFLAAKAEHLTSDHGAVDAEKSLIEGDFFSIGAGYDTGNGSTAALYLNDDYYNIELVHRGKPIRWGLYPKVMVSHLDVLPSKKGDFFRKTTAGGVGVGAKINDRLRCEAMWTQRNNTQSDIDDWFQFGCGVEF